MYTLQLSGSLGYQHFEKIIQLVTSKGNEFTLDLTAISFVDPYGMVGLLTAARYCKERNSTLKIYLPQGNVQVYLAVMNFFQNVKEYQQVSQGLWSSLKNFKADKPLLELTKLELIMGDFKNIVEFTALLYDRMEKMFNNDQLDESTNSKQITTNLIEVCQNLEHSLDYGYVAAQRYLDPLTIKIGVMDLGIGIKDALQSKYGKKGERLTDRKAIELAIKPEISSRPTGGGHGLYRLSLYIKEHAGSELIIRTGNVRCHIKHNGTRYYEGLPLFPGTQIGLTLKPGRKF